MWVAPGTYHGGIKTTASGDAGASGRIYYVSSTKWGARIVPALNGGPTSAWDNRGHYVTIMGFEIDGSKTGSGPAWRSGLYSGGSHTQFYGNKVVHIATTIPCISAGGAAIGIDSYYKGVKGEVIDNVVHDIGPPRCRFVHGIYISTSAVVKNNLVQRVSAAGIHLWHDANDVLAATFTGAPQAPTTSEFMTTSCTITSMAFRKRGKPAATTSTAATARSATPVTGPSNAACATPVLPTQIGATLK